MVTDEEAAPRSESPLSTTPAFARAKIGTMR